MGEEDELKTAGELVVGGVLASDKFWVEVKEDEEEETDPGGAWGVEEGTVGSDDTSMDDIGSKNKSRKNRKKTCTQRDIRKISPCCIQVLIG